MVSREGLPNKYEVLPGATHEGHSLLPVLQNMQQRHQVERMVCMADRGMLSAANLEALDAVGSGYVFGAQLLSPPADLPDKGFDTKAYGPLVSSDTYLYAARHAEGGIPGGRSGLLVGRRWRF